VISRIRGEVASARIAYATFCKPLVDTSNINRLCAAAPQPGNVLRLILFPGVLQSRSKQVARAIKMPSSASLIR
jgi:hypothetical protein